MDKEILEIMRVLEFEEIKEVLEKDLDAELVPTILQNEAERRCRIVVEEVQQQLNYLVNTVLSTEEILADVLSVLEGADTGIDVQTPFAILEQIGDEIQGIYPYWCYSANRGYCGGLIGIYIHLETYGDESKNESDEYEYEYDKEEKEMVVVDVNAYYINAKGYYDVFES